VSVPIPGSRHAGWHLHIGGPLTQSVLATARASGRGMALFALAIRWLTIFGLRMKLADSSPRPSAAGAGHREAAGATTMCSFRLNPAG